MKSETNFWKSKNVLVTGCTGFLGSWLTAELVKKSANVVGIIRDDVYSTNFSAMNLRDKITVVKGDITDYELVLRALNEYEIDTIFHLAAQTIVGTANNSPLSTFDTNIKGTWTILESTRIVGVRRIIVASSDKAYGNQEMLPYKEDAPLIGSHPYDVSKSCADLIARAYHISYGMNIGITRCGNLFGPGDINFSRIVPGTIKSIIFGEEPIIRSDGKFIRDYFYVKDAVNAYLLLAENVEKKGISGEAFNFGTESPITVLELVEEIIKISGKKIKPIILNEAKNEIREQYLSCEKARKLLSWKPAFSLRTALAETYKWYEEYFTKK